jgi:hypothetical protein
MVSAANQFQNKIAVLRDPQIVKRAWHYSAVLRQAWCTSPRAVSSEQSKPASSNCS